MRQVVISGITNLAQVCPVTSMLHITIAWRAVKFPAHTPEQLNQNYLDHLGSFCIATKVEGHHSEGFDDLADQSSQ